MNQGRLTSIGLVIGISLTWLTISALVVYGILQGEARNKELGALGLERIMDAQRMQLDLHLQELEKELLGEAAYVLTQDSLVKRELLDRWTAALRSDWNLGSMGLASEGGDDLVLERTDSIWRLIEVARSSEESPPLVTVWPLMQGMEASHTFISEKEVDPRSLAWFGQALDQLNREVSWSVVGRSPVDLTLYASKLIRPRQAGGSFQVIRCGISPERIMRTSSPPRSVVSLFMLTSEGVRWMMPDTGAARQASFQAQVHWSKERRGDPFTFRVDEDLYMARVVPYPLDGASGYMGAVINMRSIKAWTHRERTGLWIAAALLSVLGALLVWSILRGRRSVEQVKRQEKRSRTQQRKLARALGEREVLDREVHHRVKNNLQVVSSLLNLQAKRIHDPSAQQEFLRGKRRIDSMALVHHKLYTQRDLSALDLRAFLSQLAAAVSAMHEPASRTISHTVETHDIKADADTAIQLGMITCELLSNSFQHAFPYVTGGHVDIEVNEVGDGLFRLSVSDNGLGMDLGAPRRADALGLEIAEALADQIDGELELFSDKGTRVEVTFRMQGITVMPAGK
jgi:two-component sensor histidine kinase